MPLPPAPATLTTSPFFSMRGHHAAIRGIEHAGTVAWYRDKLDFIIELASLNGRARLDGYDVFSLIEY